MAMDPLAMDPLAAGPMATQAMAAGSRHSQHFQMALGKGRGP